MTVRKRRGLSFDILGQDKTGRAFGQVNRRLKGVTGAVSRATRAFGLFGGAISGVGLVLLGKRSIEAADNIDKLSTRLGASTEALSQYRHVAELTGVQFNTMTMAWQRMTRRIAEAAQGTGEAKDALKELGLSAEALNRLNPEQQFEVLADALGDVENQTDRVRLAFKLFDSEGVAVLQTMEDGAEGIRRMRAEADRLGKTMSKDQVAALVAAKDAWTRFNAAVEGIVQVLVVQLGPALAAIGEWLADRLPVALSWLKLKWGETWQGILLLLAHVTGAIGQMFVALAPLVSGDLHEKYKEWGQDLLDVTGNMVDMAMAARRPMEVNIATLGRFDDSLKDHAGSWRAVRLEAAAAGGEMAKAAEVAERKLDGARLASEGLGKAVEDVGSRALSGQIAGWQSLGEVATAVLQDIMREIIRTTAQLASSGFLGFLSGLLGGSPGPQFTGTGAEGLASSGSFHRGGSLVAGPSGGPDSQLMVARVSPGEKIDFTPRGGAQPAGRAPGPVFNVDMRGASAEAVARLEQLVAQVNGSIERRALAAVAENGARGGRLGAALGGV